MTDVAARLSSHLRLVADGLNPCNIIQIVCQDKPKSDAASVPQFECNKQCLPTQLCFGTNCLVAKSAKCGCVRRKAAEPKVKIRTVVPCLCFISGISNICQQYWNKELASWRLWRNNQHLKYCCVWLFQVSLGAKRLTFLLWLHFFLYDHTDLPDSLIGTVEDIILEASGLKRSRL